MTWTSPADLTAQVTRLWERGDLLRPLVTGDSPWPIRLRVKGPSSVDLTDRFSAVRHWVEALTSMPHVRFGWHEVRHRVHGLQRVPNQVWIDTLDDAVAWLGKRRDVAAFHHLVAVTRTERPELLPWFAKRPLLALEHAATWSQLLAIVRWITAHPKPGIYLRQVDVPGVDTKFIEAHRAVLAELLDLALPPEAIDVEHGGVAQFARRYGFREKPVRIRFRVLDEALRLLTGGSGLPDITLDADTFARLELPLRQVFITENETNFLAFPPVHGAIVIFGGGYGWNMLASTDWLKRCRIHYWGDIDTHGFAILDQLRHHFDQVESFLMDRPTLEQHEAHWGEEPVPYRAELSRLTADEQALFDDLRHHRWRQNLRLEQERIGYQWLRQALGPSVPHSH